MQFSVAFALFGAAVARPAGPIPDIGGLTGGLGGLTGGLGGLGGGLGGLTGGLGGLTGQLTGAANGATGALSGLTGSVGPATNGATGALGGLTGSLGGVTGALGGLTGSLGGLTGGLTGGLAGGSKPSNSTGYVACASPLASSAQCCATDVLGLLDVDCAPPKKNPTSPDNFQSECAARGQQARCCVVTLLGQGVLCQPVPFVSN